VFRQTWAREFEYVLGGTMGEVARVVETEAQSQFVRDTFDKNAAADYIAKALSKEDFNGEAMRQLHVRCTCPASGKTADGRLYWRRKTLDIYIERQKLMARNFYN
jgi:hypothetical protein